MIIKTSLTTCQTISNGNQNNEFRQGKSRSEDRQTDRPTDLSIETTCRRLKIVSNPNFNYQKSFWFTSLTEEL